jgi:hypothetical protein
VQREQDLVLVLEVGVERAGRVLDRLGDAPHGGLLERLVEEQLHRGGQDGLAHLVPVSLASLCGAHVQIAVQGLNVV